MSGVKGKTVGSHSDTGIWLIAIFKLIKGILLVAFGVGTFVSLHKDLTEIVGRWVYLLHVDPDNRYIHALLVRLMFVSPRRLEAIGAGTFIYAALVWIEGIGLLMRKHWAEYFTAIMTASFIPLEVYELVRRFSDRKVIIIGINVIIVWYLVARIQSRRKDESAAQTRGA